MNAQEYANNLMAQHPHALQMRQVGKRIDLKCACGWTYTTNRYGDAKVVGEQHLDETRNTLYREAAAGDDPEPLPQIMCGNPHHHFDHN
jgi:hypothetical protein